MNFFFLAALKYALSTLVLVVVAFLIEEKRRRLPTAPQPKPDRRVR